MRVNRFFDEAGIKAIEAAVKDAEAHSSGEIVPTVVGASSDYHWLGYRAAFLGWLAASVATLLVHYRFPFALDFWSLYAVQAAGIVMGWVFSRLPLGFRLLVSAKAIEEEVLETARSSFLANGLVNTRDRTGVLIFVSLKEHRVQILADKGIHEKVGESFWQGEADLIVRAIREGRPAEGMAQAIRDIGEKLKTHFPKRSGDTDELSNRLRRE